MRVPFRTFILVSVAVNTVYAMGFVTTGGAIFEGKAGLALVGVAVLIVAFVLTRMLHGRMKKADEKDKAAETGDNGSVR